jgi:LDH2 family malate/lactate/ureidoglycolate dehydrogenase
MESQKRGGEQAAPSRKRSKLDQTTLTLEKVTHLVQSALVRAGLNQRSASAIADNITKAERDGCASHGLFRLPGYCRSLALGKVDGGVVPEVVPARAASVVTIDCKGGFAPLALDIGIPLLVEKANQNGVAVLYIKNSFHFAALWPEVEEIAKQGLCSIACLNSKSYCAHHGGTQKMYGTNPMAFGFPRKKTAEPLVFDQASAAMARGDISLHERDGKELPPGCAIGPDGQPTTDPKTALEGSQLTFGGHKGTAIALMVELLAAALTGSPFSFEARSSDSDPSSSTPTMHGELIVAFAPQHSGANDAAGAGDQVGFQQPMLERVEGLFREVLRDEGTRLPSGRRYKNRLLTPKTGIVIPTVLATEIAELAGASKI